MWLRPDRNSADPSPRPSLALAAAVCAVLVALMAVLRLWAMPGQILPVGYGVPLVLAGWFRYRRLLWAMVAIFAALTLMKFFVVYPRWAPDETGLTTPQRVSAAATVLLDLVVIAVIVHVLISVRERLRSRNAELAANVRELAAREEQVARQGVELRVANEELAQRQRTLEVLLDLSRALTVEHSRRDMMSRVCETAGRLVDGSVVASAILEHEGDRVVVRCHAGFGPEGIQSDEFALSESFASLVMSQGRTDFLEDVSRRPDLKIPQPKAGEPMASILAAPLRAAGWPVGTLEVYSRRPGPWTGQQVALVESLAAQASLSLEAVQLFEKVERERTRFETVLRTVPFGIAVCDAGYTDLRLNPAGAAMFGLPPDTNLLGEPGMFNLSVYREGRLLLRDEYPLRRAAREGHDVRGVELELVQPTGRRVAVLTHASPFRDRDGKVVGAVAAFVDITAQKDLQRELDAKRREAEEASVRKTRFLAAVSHDIRTPANAINLLAELIRRASVNPAMAGEVPEMAKELQASAVSLVDLLSDVLDLARYDSGRVEMNESTFALGELLGEEHRRMAPTAREKGLALNLSTPAEPVWVRADRIKLSRVIGNLLGNAIKFTDKGEVRLEAEVAAGGDGSAEVRVADTGVGIPAEYQRNIFDEFFQLRNPERDRTKGAGLGLTICKRLVDAMGGELKVHSEPGRGSTFTVVLPAGSVLTDPT